MKRIFLFLTFITTITVASAQPGLIGHWTFDGNANDVSGNGLNGVLNNVVPDTGYWGFPNTAYRFNGTNSSIGIPYKPIMNVNRFSIVALVQIRGYYNGTCQAEHILKRGVEFSSGNYGLIMFDNALDGGDCNAFDSSKFTFSAWGPAVPPVQWAYSPAIVSHRWYRVVVTFDSTNYTLYINGQVKLTCSTTAGPVGTSTDSMVIGRNYDNLINYPYWFNGLIDDIKLFNRALTTAEVTQLEGIEDVNSSLEITLSPNPTTGIITIKGIAQPSVAVYNLMGQKVVASQGSNELSLSSLPSGMYMVVVYDKEGALLKTEKIIKE